MPNVNSQNKKHGINASVPANGTSKQQSAFEFITTYGWAILILAVVIVLLYYFIGIPSTTVPSTCKFLFGSNCQGIVATSLASSTKMTMVITNAQSYPIFNPLIKVATDSYGNLSAACLPANALISPGSEIICNVTIPQKISPGTPITGTIYMSVDSCPSGNINNCQPKQLQTYKGNIITRVTSQSSGIHLTSTSTSSTSSTSTSTSSTSTSSTSTSSTSSTSTTTSTSTSTTSISCVPGSQTWTPIFSSFGSTYSFTFNTPVNCGTSIVYTISVTGAGGGGGSGVWGAPNTGSADCSTSVAGGGGGGGGGGGYATGSISGIPSSTTFNVITGIGGPESIGYNGGPCLFAGETGGNGGWSYVQGPSFKITAYGGYGGQEQDAPANGAGGAGGSWVCTGITCTGTNGLPGDIEYVSSGVYYGGTGGNSANVLSGSGGPGGPGGSWNPSTAVAEQGTYNAYSGYLNGGGGGGGGAGDNNNGGDIGGTGGNGVVVISWN